MPPDSTLIASRLAIKDWLASIDFHPEGLSRALTFSAAIKTLNEWRVESTKDI